MENGRAKTFIQAREAKVNTNWEHFGPHFLGTHDEVEYIVLGNDERLTKGSKTVSRI